MSSKLLHTPDGVRDLYGDELSLKGETQKKVRKLFKSYGYREIQTPTFEYFDMFSNKIGTTPSKELYKFFDKEGDTLVLRPDFTPSIARCAAKYYMDENIPVRFYYKGNAFVNSSLLQGKLKETTQMGVEFIGDGSASADAELIGMSVKALSDVGLKDFQISLGNIDFMKGLCESAGIDEDTEKSVRDAISIKNFFGVCEMLKNEQVDDKFIRLFMKLSDIYDDDESLEEWKSFGLNARCVNAISRLQEIYSILKIMGVSKFVSFDLGMVSKYNYYTGMIFKGYTYGVGDAIIKGGRYDTLLSIFDKDAPATGFVILIDDLVTALKRNGKKAGKSELTMIMYKENELEKAIKQTQKLRDDGNMVTMSCYMDNNLSDMKAAFERDGFEVIVL